MSQRISVIIPAYNAGQYISEALRSILQQNIPAHEIIVIDDGSEDETRSLVTSFPEVDYLWQARQGTPIALNTAVNRSTGNFLAFLDADDLWMPQKLQLQLQAFEKDPDLEMVFGLIEQFASPELSESDLLEIEFDQTPMVGIHKSTWLIKRDSFLKIGLFDGAFLLEEFIDWYLKAKEKKLKERIIPHVLAKRRIHKLNLSRTSKELRKDFPRVLKAGLDRRRAQENSRGL